MSIESAKAFIERMNTDQEFAGKFNDLKTEADAKSYVISHGFDFTFEELLICRGEIDDLDLVQVSGGFGPECETALVRGCAFCTGSPSFSACKRP